MDEPQSLDSELMQAVLVELIREGVVPRHIIERVERRFEQLAQGHAGTPQSQRYETLARIALSIHLESDGPSSSDYRAAQRRQQIHVVSDAIEPENS